MAFAEENLARAEIAEGDQLRELRPAPLEEAVRHAMAWTNHDDAIAQRRGNHVIEVAGALVDSAFGLALQRDEHHRIAAMFERGFVRRVIRHAAVAETLAEDERRARVERREIVRGEQEIDRMLDVRRGDEKSLPIAQTRDRNETRKRIRRVQAIADEAREVAAMHLRVAPGRMLDEQIAQIEIGHAHERLPEEANALLHVRRDDRRVPGPRGHADAHRRANAEGGESLDHADLERAARRAAGEDEGDLLRSAEAFE